MTCKDLDGLITDYLEEALSPPARIDFEAHLAVCPHCRKCLDEMHVLIQASHDLGGKINQERSARTGETQEQYFERLQAKTMEKSRVAKERYRKLAPAAVAVVAIAVVAGVWLHQQAVRKAMAPQDLTIDLSHWLRLRGAEQPPQPPVKLKRALLDLTILQPVGTLPGKYQVAIWKNRRVVVQGAARADFVNHLTALHVRLDCRPLKEGDYILAIRKDNWQVWEEYPVIVQ